MYQSSYAEILEDDQTTARRVEAMALDRAVELLADAAQVAKIAPPRASMTPATAPALSREGIEALHYTCQLWMVFASELASPQNALPEELRARLISIAIWVLKEADAIRTGRSTNYAGIADICVMIRDGLR